jgi:hypothetical protein
MEERNGLARPASRLGPELVAKVVPESHGRSVRQTISLQPPKNVPMQEQT